MRVSHSGVNGDEMSDDDSTQGFFRAGEAYHILEVARRMRVTKRWVEENMINNEKNPCAHKRQGNTVMFVGRWIIDWLENDIEIR